MTSKQWQTFQFLISVRALCFKLSNKAAATRRNPNFYRNFSAIVLLTKNQKSVAFGGFLAYTIRTISRWKLHMLRVILKEKCAQNIQSFIQSSFCLLCSQIVPLFQVEMHPGPYLFVYTFLIEKRSTVKGGNWEAQNQRQQQRYRVRETTEELSAEVDQ